MFEKYLEDIGLSEKESLVYLTLLKVDNASVIDISKKTKINRTTVYPILESLSQKGLISEVKVDKKTEYQAESPERLKTYIQRQKILLDEHENRLKDIIPQMKAVSRSSGEKSVVKIYEGRDGVISSLEEFYKNTKKGGDLYSIYNRDLIDEIFTQKERKKFYQLRIDKIMFSRAIYNRKGEEIKTDDNISNRIKFDENKYPIDSDITISDDVVIFSSLKKNVSSIYIKNKDIADTIKSLVKYIIDNK